MYFNVAFSQRSTICLPALCHVFAVTGTEMKFINAAETVLNVKSNDLKLLFMRTILWVLILSKCQFKKISDKTLDFYGIISHANTYS